MKNRNYFKNRTVVISINMILMLIFTLFSVNSYASVNDLRNSGYSLIPAPQKTELTGKKLVLNGSWTIDSKLSSNSIVIKRLRTGALELKGIQFSSTGKNKVILELLPGSIKKDLIPEAAQQAYILVMNPGLVKITSNSEQGLYYGVQSLLQLLKPEKNDSFSLPEGKITDWPDLYLRIIHWDTKHHQDRIETLKRYLDWLAYFKVNAVAFEIEDKYEYPSHPVIGAPGAFTKAEMQDLTAYARERFIQLVPDVQAPSHLSYVLKHEEFAHLRADSSNYHICMCNEEAMQLIQDMYQDMIDATPGVNYFLVSTDEIYFAGICNECDKEYNEINRSQAWVDYAKRMNKWMLDHGRRMISWIEFPLLPEDIYKLPSEMIDGVVNIDWIKELNRAGIQQLIYNSIQGEEYLFPNYFRVRHKESEQNGNLQRIPLSSVKALDMGANLIGSFTAAWDDSGLHNELFWLGWVSGIQYSWSVGTPSIEQNIADFMDIFYGYDSPDMVEMYRLLQDGANFYQGLWDRVISKERGPGYGDWYGKGLGTERFDQTLGTLPIPDINSDYTFRNKYASKIKDAELLIRDNDKLINLLMHNLSHVSRNHYNLEVMLSIASLEQYTINTLLNLAKIEDYLADASRTGYDYNMALSLMVNAYNLAGEILKGEEKEKMNIKKTWEKSRFEKCRSVDGREFMHVLDDLKDHFADRRLDIDYMLAPFERMEIEKWQTKLMAAMKDFADKHSLTITGLNMN